VDEIATQQMHTEFCKKLGVSQNSFIVMYHGSITSGRGIETLIRLVSLNLNICAVILGFGDAGYVDSLKKQASGTEVEKRVLFYPAVPVEELWRYVGAADVEIMVIEPLAKSYYYALPNKLFESIQSLTPILASNYPEMKNIIEEYSIGLTCDPKNLQEIDSCIERMRTDKAFYAQCKENLKRAKQELCWENEKNVLIEELERLQKNAS
jgi:glycosyltransferase involved in cell wall biosynthesis